MTSTARTPQCVENLDKVGRAYRAYRLPVMCVGNLDRMVRATWELRASTLQEAKLA